MELIRLNRHDDVLRRSFNALTEQTFGFTFENWYRLGYWREDYRPYVMVENGEVVANVSVNHTNFSLAGEEVPLIQLGTVMTHPDYRGQGLIRRIMEEIEADYAGKVAGMYLFANDEVLDFYPKFGFCRGEERRYTRSGNESGKRNVEQRSMSDASNRAAFEKAMKHPAGAFPMVGNEGLVFFYTTSFMSECVWYAPTLDAWAVAELEGDMLMLHAVYGATTEEMIAAFGSDVSRVQLGYAPEQTAGYEVTLLAEEDCTFFVKGDFFASFQRLQLRIPVLSHA